MGFTAELREINANELRALDAYGDSMREDLCVALWMLRNSLERFSDDVRAEDRRWFHDRVEALLDRRPEAMKRHLIGSEE